MREFQYDAWLGNIQKHRITHIQTAPPILVMLAKRPETDKYDLSSLVNILCGAAPLSKELQNEVSDKLNLKIVQTWVRLMNGSPTRPGTPCGDCLRHMLTLLPMRFLRV